ncbi:hypothetical protein MIS33_08565 [Wielerella bovis]|uniref:hypothetical protein n=1 Tax=Wielerella bovis TaxID=2917790 RepID=UPI002019524E|nr:hypothetical protein [Wielerella bovis]ULJ64202.1 hypothetical protein MIS33_08565 [Wielerella bovis]
MLSLNKKKFHPKSTPQSTGVHKIIADALFLQQRHQQKQTREILLFNQDNNSEELGDLNSKNIMHALIYPDEHFEYHIITAFRGVIFAESIAQLIQDFSPRCAKDLSDTAQLARVALQTAKQAGESPNQRRRYFQDVRLCFELVNIWQDALSNDTLVKLATFEYAVSICSYAVPMLEEPHQVLDSLFALMQGKSLREMAKHHQYKETVLRQKILQAAQSLWIVKATTMPYIESIPDLRHSQLAQINNLTAFIDTVRQAFYNVVQPFQAATGLNILLERNFLNSMDTSVKRLAAV